MPFKGSVFQHHIVSLLKHHKFYSDASTCAQRMSNLLKLGSGRLCGCFIQSETYLLGVGHLLSKIKANEPDIAGKSALKMTNLHNLKVIRPKRAKILLCKGEKFYRRLYAVRVVPHLKVKSTIRRCLFWEQTKA